MTIKYAVEFLQQGYHVARETWSDGKWLQLHIGDNQQYDLREIISSQESVKFYYSIPIEDMIADDWVIIMPSKKG